MYGTGLVELHKYKEALGPLDEAIKVAGKTRGAAYPTIAITAKIEALSGLGDNKAALALAAEDMRRVSAYHLAGHLYEIYQTRADVYERIGQWKPSPAMRKPLNMQSSSPIGAESPKWMACSPKLTYVTAHSNPR
jgi:tetratricopeptide (TPR) repeat protein